MTELHDLIDQLTAHGQAHGNWELCFTQLTAAVVEIVVAQAAEAVQLTARLESEQDTVKVHTRLRSIAEGRVRHLEALLASRDRQISTLQEAGGTVLQELRRLQSLQAELKPI